MEYLKLEMEDGIILVPEMSCIFTSAQDGDPSQVDLVKGVDERVDAVGVLYVEYKLKLGDAVMELGCRSSQLWGTVIAEVVTSFVSQEMVKRTSHPRFYHITKTSLPPPQLGQAAAMAIVSYEKGAPMFVQNASTEIRVFECWKSRWDNCCPEITNQYPNGNVML
ncbi:hypothetical protein Tco_0532971 [Tanacetum coccineum]